MIQIRYIVYSIYNIKKNYLKHTNICYILGGAVLLLYSLQI